MTRSRLVALLAVPALCAPALAGCGAEDVTGVDVARAATATREKGTAHVEMIMHLSGLGLPRDVELTAEGVTALGRPRMNLAMDFGPLLSAAGVGGDGTIELRLDGGDLYVKPPPIQALDLPEWIGVDLARVADAIGIDPDAAGALFTFDLASQLRAMRSAGDLEAVRTEDVGGEKTTLMRGSFSTRDLLDVMPAARRRRAQAALDRLADLGGGPDMTAQRTPVELWIDDDSIVRRLRTTVQIPSQNGTGPRRAELAYDLEDFGAELDVSRPAGVVDYTDRIVGALGGAGLGG